MACVLSLVACGSDAGSDEDQDEGALGEDAPPLQPEPSGPASKHAFVLAHESEEALKTRERAKRSVHRRLARQIWVVREAQSH